MTIFDLLTPQHNKWVRYAANMLSKADSNVCTPDDLVSDMYIKMYASWGEEALERRGNTIEDVMYGDQINYLYVWKALNACLMNRLNDNKKYLTETHLNNNQFVDYERNSIVEGYISVDQHDENNLEGISDNMNREEVMRQFLDEIIEELDSMYWFDSKLLKVYLMDDHSMRSLADKSGISLTTIFHSLKGTKNKLKVKFMPVYADILLQLEEYDAYNRIKKEYEELTNGMQIDLFDMIADVEKENNDGE